MAHNKLSNTDKGAIVKSITQKLMLRSDMQLVVKADKIRRILLWGKDNKYPGYLLSLYKGQPQHAGIIKGKAKYIAGLSTQASTPQGKQWLSHANKEESWQDLRVKLTEDKVLYGGYAIKVVPNLTGTPLWYFHMDFGKLRISDDMEEVRYSDDWSKNGFNTKIVTYPIWYPGCTEISIYLYRNYNPTIRKIEAAYPALEYESGIKSIDTLKRVQNFKNSLVANNFSSGTVITIFSGKPATEEEERYLSETIKGEHTGDEKAGNTVILFADETPNAKPADIQSISVNDLDKQFDGVTTSETINVFAAHRVPAELFNYISDGAHLFDVNKIVEQNELFMNAYVLPTQEQELKMLSQFYKARTGVDEEFSIEQFKPIGIELPLDNPVIVKALIDKDPNIVINYLNKKYNLGLQDAPIAPTKPGVAPSATVQQAQVNEHLKNLTGRQMQGIGRIERKFKAGQLSAGQAKILLKPFGLTDSEMNEYLGIQPPAPGKAPIQQRVAFAKQQDFFTLFDKYSHPVNKDDETIEVKLYQGPLTIDITDLRNSILKDLQGDPSLTPTQLAELYGVEVSEIKTELDFLTTSGFLSNNEGSFLPTKKAFDDETGTTTEFYTEYTYGLRPGVKGPVILSTTREWCREMYAKYSRDNKAISFDKINEMSNDFGMNAFDFKGGFYNDPSTGEIEPYCRHAWIAHIKVKKTKNG